MNDRSDRDEKDMSLSNSYELSWNIMKHSLQLSTKIFPEQSGNSLSSENSCFNDRVLDSKNASTLTVAEELCLDTRDNEQMSQLDALHMQRRNEVMERKYHNFSDHEISSISKCNESLRKDPCIFGCSSASGNCLLDKVNTNSSNESLPDNLNDKTDKNISCGEDDVDKYSNDEDLSENPDNKSRESSLPIRNKVHSILALTTSEELVRDKIVNPEIKLKRDITSSSHLINYNKPESDTPLKPAPGLIEIKTSDSVWSQLWCNVLSQSDNSVHKEGFSETILNDINQHNKQGVEEVVRVMMKLICEHVDDKEVCSLSPACALLKLQNCLDRYKSILKNLVERNDELSKELKEIKTAGHAKYQNLVQEHKDRLVHIIRDQEKQLTAAVERAVNARKQASSLQIQLYFAQRKIQNLETSIEQFLALKTTETKGRMSKLQEGNQHMETMLQELINKLLEKDKEVANFQTTNFSLSSKRDFDYFVEKSYMEQLEEMLADKKAEVAAIKRTLQEEHHRNQYLWKQTKYQEQDIATLKSRLEACQRELLYRDRLLVMLKGEFLDTCSGATAEFLQNHLKELYQSKLSGLSQVMNEEFKDTDLFSYNPDDIKSPQRSIKKHKIEKNTQASEHEKEGELEVSSHHSQDFDCVEITKKLNSLFSLSESENDQKISEICSVNQCGSK